MTIVHLKTTKFWTSQILPNFQFQDSQMTFDFELSVDSQSIHARMYYTWAEQTNLAGLKKFKIGVFTVITLLYYCNNN